MEIPSQPTTDLPTAAKILGIGRAHAYNLAARDEFPVPLIRLGARIVVPTAPLRELLGITQQPA